MRKLFSMTASSVLLSVFLLVGCGGGGGGSTAPAASTLSGTAAVGAPIVGTVTIKDSSTPFQTKEVTIAANGNYTIDVTGLTPPFMLRADGTAGGRSHSLYSAAVSADINGTINITPLTDLIVANVVGDIASRYFAGPNFSSLTAADLAAQETALRARLQPLLAAAGVGASIDLLRSSFAADRTGLDAALEVLRVDIVGGTATITNIISNQQITDNIASKTDTIVPIGATGVATGLTEFQQIVARFDTFSALFATALPASNNATLLAMLDPFFLFDGDNTAAFLSDLTSDPALVGVKFTNLALVPGSMTPIAAPTTVKVSFSIVFLGRTIGHVAPEFTLNKAGAVWKMAGNGRIASADAYTFARLQDVFITDTLQTNYIDTGLSIEIKAPTTAGLASLINTPVPNGAAYYAIVTGAGLPGAGALYVSDFSQPGGSFYAAAGTQTAYEGQNTRRLNNFGHNQYPLSDAAIAAIGDNEIYTIKIYHDGATAGANQTGNDVLLATYTSKLGKRPYLKTELSVASFAKITAPTQSALTTFANAGGTITVSWTLPPGAKWTELHYFRRGSTGFTSTDVRVSSGPTSASLTILSPADAGIGTVQNNGLTLFIEDSFGRELVTNYNGS